MASTGLLAKSLKRPAELRLAPEPVPAALASRPPEPAPAGSSGAARGGKAGRLRCSSLPG